MEMENGNGNRVRMCGIGVGVGACVCVCVNRAKVCCQYCAKAQRKTATTNKLSYYCTYITYPVKHWHTERENGVYKIFWVLNFKYL